MSYSHIQFVAYMLDTAPKMEANDSQTYLGLADPKQDIKARCALMLRAMQTARDALSTSSPPEPPGQTLKVFMAPEFYFRGQTGAYQMDDVQLVISTLQAMVESDDWLDWVFVFGTIIGVSSPTSPLPPYDSDPNAVKEVYNFALVQQGGVLAQGDAGARIVSKELKSGIDFIAAHANPGGLLLGQVQPMNASRTGGWGREQQKLNYDGAGVFSLAGITWGLEVCLDHLHSVHRLLNSPQLPGENLVQVQLVPSCGMSIQNASVVVQSGGYVFNCDGMRPNGSAALLQKVPPSTAKWPRASLAVSGTAIPLDGTSPLVDVPIRSLYAGGAGVVNLYPEQIIPAQQKAPGHRVTLHWTPEDSDCKFSFLLVYDDKGNYQTLMCEISSKTVSFEGNRYDLPLAIDTQNNFKQKLRIHMSFIPGTDGYDQSVWCEIDVPGFAFEGIAFQFSFKSPGDRLPNVIW